MRGVQVKLWDPLRTRAIPERLKGVITTRRYANPRLPLPLPLLPSSSRVGSEQKNNMLSMIVLSNLYRLISLQPGPFCYIFNPPSSIFDYLNSSTWSLYSVFLNTTVFSHNMPTVIYLASPNALQQLSNLVQMIQTFIHFTMYQWNLSNFRLNEPLLSHLMLTPSIYLTITSTIITLTSSMDKKQHNHRCNRSPDSPPPHFKMPIHPWT